MLSKSLSNRSADNIIGSEPVFGERRAAYPVNAGSCLA